MHIYFINSTIQGALSDNHFTVMDATAKSDLVFLLDGRAYLDYILQQPQSFAPYHDQ